MSNFETITVERRGKVAVLTINRPDKLNALNSKVHTEGVAALDELRNDDSVRVLVITGSGEKSFIAGADISEFEGQTPVTQRDTFHETFTFQFARHLSQTRDRDGQRFLSRRRKRAWRWRATCGFAARMRDFRSLRSISASCAAAAERSV